VKRLDLTPIVMAGLAVGVMSLACGTDPGEDSDTTGDSIGTIPPPTGGESNTGMESAEDTMEVLDVGGGGTGNPTCDNGDVNCTDEIDLLFVIDNSGTMGEEQINLARNFPLLISQLENLSDSQGMPVNADVQIMVTTTDFGNPLCTQFEPPGYDPSKGAPIDSSCTTRLQDFTDLIGTTTVEQACTNTCPVAVEPEGDPYIAFNPMGDNIPDSVVPIDIDGDAVPDSPAAQALSCIGPQGINGCGYESPLENMLQALNPTATWNDGPDMNSPNPRPFLRDGALLAIAVVTDEADCSVKDYSIMENPAFQNVNPDTGMAAATSAICWNAGVTCNGPDAMGIYSSCTSQQAENLQPISRYTNYLINELRESQGKEVIMLGILGVPLVTMRNPDPPFQPTAGGVFDLVYRNWVDGQYPVGDILPDEFASGETAADKQYDFGIGPGCTGTDSLGQFTGQAIPPVRVKEVCESLNLGPNPEDTRCCIESICDEDFSPAIRCLTGIIQESIQLPG
jgi:hypothetical protein